MALKGEQLVAAAESKLKSSFTLKFAEFFGGETRQDRVDAAVELFSKAALAYSLERRWVDSMNALKRAAEGCSDPNAKARLLREAANKALRMETNDGRRQHRDLGLEAAKLFAENGQPRAAADMNYKIACDAGLIGLDESGFALTMFRRAEDLYAASDSATCERKCREQCALIHGDRAEYVVAAEILFSLAESVADQPFLLVRAYLFNALCCTLAAKMQGLSDYHAFTIEDEMNRAVDISPPFDVSLFSSIAAAITEASVEKFTLAVSEWDRFQRLTAWQTRVLLSAKHALLRVDNESLL